jgi:hypothetical protein
MVALFTGTFLLLMLPFLLSLAGQPGIPKLLCLVTSLLAVLLSVEAYAAILPWLAGMAIAVISVRERLSSIPATSFSGARIRGHGATMDPESLTK